MLSEKFVALRFVRRDRRNNVRSDDGVLGARAADNGKTGVGHVPLEFFGGRRIDIIDPQSIDAEGRLKGAGLKFRLRSQANQRHGFALRPREIARRESGGGGGPERRGERHIRQEARIAGRDIGQHAEGRDGLQAA